MTTTTEKSKNYLIEALVRLYYHNITPATTTLDHLKKTHHVTPTGKVSAKGKTLIDCWFARGADRTHLLKEL